MKEMDKSTDTESLYRVLTDFYKIYGVGVLGLNRAFRLNNDGTLAAITYPGKVELTDIALYDSQKARLEENPVAFLQKKPANNA